MDTPSVSSRDLVNQWLEAINNKVPEEGGFLDENGVCMMVREDGEQLMIQVSEGSVSFLVVVLTVPEEDATNWFQAALTFNLHANLVRGGHFAYEPAGKTLTYCVHLPVDELTQEFFTTLLQNVIGNASEFRELFFTLAGAEPGLEPEEATLR